MNGGFWCQEIKNSLKKTAEQKKGAAQSVCRPCMNRGATIYNNSTGYVCSQNQTTESVCGI